MASILRSYAFDKERGQLVAIKKISDAFSNPVQAKMVLREVKLLRYMDHPNIVAIRDIIPPVHRESFTDVYIASELMKSNLRQLIFSGEPLIELQCQSFLYQLLCGLKYMHSANILHRDLKPSNLLLDKAGVLKICDLGLARTVATSDLPMTPQVGTLWYKAPEILLHSTSYSATIDVWSVGCILMELMMQRPLFPGEWEDQQLGLVLEQIGTPDKDADLSFLDLTGTCVIWSHLCHPKRSFHAMCPTVESKLAFDLVERMLLFDPRKRITIQGALAHSYLATLRDISRSQAAPSTSTLTMSSIQFQRSK